MRKHTPGPSSFAYCANRYPGASLGYFSFAFLQGIAYTLNASQTNPIFRFKISPIILGHLLLHMLRNPVELFEGIIDYFYILLVAIQPPNNSLFNILLCVSALRSS